MMPIGALIARYVKVFEAADPAWFYLHVSCQSLAYLIGVAGWGTGLQLGSESPSIQYTAHRCIGITLFVFGTLQVILFFLKSFQGIISLCAKCYLSSSSTVATILDERNKHLTLTKTVWQRWLAKKRLVMALWVMPL